MVFQTTDPGTPLLSAAISNTATAGVVVLRTGTSTWFTCQMPGGTLNPVA